MKKVLIDMHRLKHNPYNGLYIFSKELGHHLAELRPADLDLHFYLPTADFGTFGNKVSYEKHRSIDKFFRFGTGKFDVWHVTTTLSWYKPFHKKVKVVYNIHDLHFLVENKDQRESNKRTLDRIIKRATEADYIVAISQYSLKIANQLLPIANKPQKVIYNGTTCKEFPGFNAPRYRPQKPFLFSIGQLFPRKNFHVLPALLKFNDYELVIAGLPQSNYGNRVLEEARKNGVENRVSLIGPVSEEEKYWYYKNCLAFMFPSFAEGFGLPVIEAMNYEKPVFLSTETCLPEIGGDAAYYFENFDPDCMNIVLEKGLKDYAENNRRQEIRKHSEKFNWNNAANQYVNVYRELL